jgi:dihydrofolate reductase
MMFAAGVPSFESGGMTHDQTMGRIVAVEHVTLDGVMQGPGRPDEDRRDGFEFGGWASAAHDALLQKVVGERMGNSWSLLVGRVTYGDLAGFWPMQPKPNPFTDVLNSAEKFVTSNTLVEPLPWQNSTLLKGDAAQVVANLKEKHRKQLVIFGSGVLVQSLMLHDLIDEFVLQIHPLVLGKGRRLFGNDSPRTNLKLSDSVRTNTGVVVATYHPVH